MAYGYPTHDDPLGQGYSDTPTTYKRTIDLLLSQLKNLRTSPNAEGFDAAMERVRAADEKVEAMREECFQRIAGYQKQVELMRETHARLMAEALSQINSLDDALNSCRANIDELRAELERAGR